MENNGAVLFSYHRRQRDTAKILGLNIVVALAMYAGAYQFLPEGDTAVQELLAVADIAIVVVVLCLLAGFFYLYKKNEAVEVIVTPSTFFYHDPYFSSLTIEVAVKDILSITQTTDVQQDFHTTRIHMKDGKSHQLMLINHRLDRAALYEALKKANPTIELPEHPNRFKKRVPDWVKKLRK